MTTQQKTILALSIALGLFVVATAVLGTYVTLQSLEEGQAEPTVNENVNKEPSPKPEEEEPVDEEEMEEEEEPEEEPVYEISYTNASENLIRIESPEPGARITSPLQLTGEARGTWFFEATAPVVLVDWDGLIIAEGYVTATGDWMTEDFVPFEGELEFDRPSFGDTGAVIFQASNPSDLPENDRAAEVPIRY